MRRAALLALALLAVPLAGCIGGDGSPSTVEPLAWSFTDTEGDEHSNGTAAGSPTVLFFMATWCESCKQKTDDLRAVQADFAERDVDVFSLSVDPQETDADLETWKATHDQPWPHGVDENLTVARTMDVQSTSNVVVLDGDNQLVQHWDYGEANEQAVRSVLDNLLA
jgi:peroxiredoxin